MLARKFWTPVLSLALAFLSFSLVQGQSTYGSVAGFVTDSSGAAIVNAQVALTNLGTSEKRTQSTVADGLYSFVTVIPANIALRLRSRVSNASLASPLWCRCSRARVSTSLCRLEWLAR